MTLSKSDVILDFLASRTTEYKENQSVAEAAISEVAAGWLGTLDRSAIGSMALPLEALVIAGAIRKVEAEVTNSRTQSALKLIMRERLVHIFWSGDQVEADQMRHMAGAEFCYWSEVVHGERHPGMDDYADSFWHTRQLLYMTQVTECPDRLPYFEAGLTDVDFVDRCIADGIDTDIAASASL